MAGCFHPIGCGNAFVSSLIYQTMAQHLYNFSMYFGYVLDIILLIFSLKFCLRKSNPKFIRIFPIFSFANISGDICSMIGLNFSSIDHPIFLILAYFIFSLIPLFELIFFNYILFQLVRSVLAKKISWFLNFIFLVSFVFFGISILLV